MEKIYSKIDRKLVLHVINRFSDIQDQKSDRADIIEAGNFIQCSSLKMKDGKTFKPHKHIYKKRTYEKQIAQESWVVIQGAVRCIFYDIDDTVIVKTILLAGDASFTLAGGHTYEILEDNTIVYEYKTGPYEGQENDKEFID